MDFSDFASVLWLMLVIVILLIVISLPLYLTARWLDEDKGFIWAFVTTILLIVSFVVFLALIPVPVLDLIMAVIVNLAIIKVSYDTYWGKTLIMWIMTVVIAVVMLIIIEFILGLGLLALPFQI